MPLGREHAGDTNSPLQTGQWIHIQSKSHGLLWLWPRILVMLWLGRWLGSSTSRMEKLGWCGCVQGNFVHKSLRISNIIWTCGVTVPSLKNNLPIVVDRCTNNSNYSSKTNNLTQMNCQQGKLLIVWINSSWKVSWWCYTFPPLIDLVEVPTLPQCRLHGNQLGCQSNWGKKNICCPPYKYIYIYIFCSESDSDNWTLEYFVCITDFDMAHFCRRKLSLPIWALSVSLSKRPKALYLWDRPRKATRIAHVRMSLTRASPHCASSPESQANLVISTCCWIRN